MRRLFLLCVIVAAGCGGSSSSSPSSTSVSGTWGGNVQQTSASGGPECLLSFQSQNGASQQQTLQITQTGTDLTATETSLTTGASCQLTGTSTTTTVTLNATACAPTMVTATCNGNSRDLYLSTRAINANVNGNLMNGTISDHWNAYASGDTTTILGTVIVTSSLVLSR